MKTSFVKNLKSVFEVKTPGGLSKAAEEEFGQAGFSLVEVTISMVIFLIAIMGVFFSFAYAVSYNAGNNSRAQALAILQQKVEQMRSLKFVPTSVDAKLNAGTTTQTVTLADGNKFAVKVTVDDNPSIPDVQTDTTTKFKEVTVIVSLERPTPGWQTAVPAKVVLRRVRGN
jgi:prepilin-type N-terminal cleavage/methylation domain-containing protein